MAFREFNTQIRSGLRNLSFGVTRKKERRRKRAHSCIAVTELAQKRNEKEKEAGGVPGIGKTQLGIQLAINVQIPVKYGGLGGKAIYIDTEGSFMVERAQQIADACANEIAYGAAVQREHFQPSEERINANFFLENIFCFRVCSYTEQIAVVNNLDNFIASQDNIRIVIIDSITFHFRQHFEDLALRTRVLSSMVLKLMKVAKKYKLAVVLLNQVTSKFANGTFHLTLALGESWSHACTNRVILYWSGNDRFASIDKSSSLPAASAPYSVTSLGIRNAATPCKRIRIQ
ncbi:DNA repair protein RAD51 homolog 3 isoform X2 [Nymphaea colorata]|uniref:DNA repair protein RAD51 homolog 3 isoform X2 n=1 Tax=Nymphaea colorata TaxID=210225 RepID=UPI00129D880C|nr:DNA repair protein RAD51 homolog 3 isoform X2 [Nymphaea colorata]